MVQLRVAACRMDVQRTCRVRSVTGGNACLSFAHLHMQTPFTTTPATAPLSGLSLLNFPHTAGQVFLRLALSLAPISGGASILHRFPPL